MAEKHLILFIRHTKKRQTDELNNDHDDGAYVRDIPLTSVTFSFILHTDVTDRKKLERGDASENRGSARTCMDARDNNENIVTVSLKSVFGNVHGFFVVFSVYCLEPSSTVESWQQLFWRNAPHDSNVIFASSNSSHHHGLIGLKVGSRIELQSSAHRHHGSTRKPFHAQAYGLVKFFVPFICKYHDQFCFVSLAASSRHSYTRRHPYVSLNDMKTRISGKNHLVQYLVKY
ncbi:hypothetical protein KP509_08G029800 [Ceratopteris richardii]|uniref:Uncharacterized protein n=1 Tax=Ceratopteris richardii TaxID=49495 RepID=A0A8T2UB40_CERRI|nr:hypothetical protein KP509_08G029800 [Ceratopteris richardii]